jgi:hypothetical protein
MKRLLTFLIAMCFVATPILMAQTSGDYRSAVNGGNWSTAATWEKYDGSAWATATAAPGATNNVTIRNGYDVILDASGKNCKNLYIEAGATFKSGQPTTTVRYVRVNGDSAVINGTFGDPTNGDGISFENTHNGSTVVITGTGTFAPNRVRVNSAVRGTTTIFDIDTKFMYTGSSGTGGVALYPQTNNNTFIFNAGKTITFVDLANIGAGSSVSTLGTSDTNNVTFIVNGTMNLSNANNTFNLMAVSGKTSTLTVGSTGSVVIGGKLLTSAAGAGTSDITVDGSLTVNGSATFGNENNYIDGTGSFILGSGATMNIGVAAGLDATNGPIRTTTKTFDAGATYVYNGTAAQVTGTDLPATVGALTINNAAGVTLSQATTVTGALTLTSGDLALNGNTLTYMMATGDGTLSETAALNAPTAVNVGSLGATLTSAADLGSTVVKRGFTAQTVNSKSGIGRWYFITPTTNTGLNATLVFAYDEAELNGISESLLTLYSSADTGKTWTARGGVVDATNNNITLTGIDGFSMWTAASVVGLEGTYYVGAAGTKPGGGDPDFLTLNAACDSLSNGVVTGDITMYITSDLTEPTNVDLAVTTDYTITFKPYTGVSPTVTYTQTADNAGASGAWVIGMKNTSGAAYVPTHNIVIDGSNTEAGSTRDLTFVSAHGKNAYPFRLKGNCDNITIKNCIMSADTSAIAYGIWVNSQDNNIPDNLTIDNCSITAISASTGTPIHISYSGTITAAMENLKITNNDLIARTRGIFLNGNTNIATIEGNTIEVNQTATGYLSSAVMGNKIFSTGTTYIIGNDFAVNSTANVAASNGIRTITASGGGTFIIANNFFRGFAAPTASGAASEIIGIRCGSTVEAYYNTFVLNNIEATTGSLYRAINIAAGTPIIKNNIFVVEENDFTAYCIGGMPGESDFNNFYLPAANANVGFKTVAVPTLAVWQDSTGGDTHSVTKAVEFASSSDLHLAGASVGDFDLAGTPIAGITTDIDGDMRASLNPYMGADEAATTLQFVAPQVFISEYIEGSSNNKALEIYNNTGSAVDLSRYTIKAANNGTGWGCVGGTPDTRYVLPLAGTLAAGDVFVVYNSAADAAIVAVGDLGKAYNATVNGGDGDNVPAFNGDDAIGLFYGDSLIDVIGVPTTDPGTNWPVAGTGATSEYTLVRKASVVTGNTDWTTSSGTNATDSEWEVYPQDTFGYLGEHPTVLPTAMSKAMSTSLTEIKVIYTDTLTTTKVGDFSVLGSSGITFTSAVLDPSDPKNVLLTASADIVGDIVLDTLIDSANEDSVFFYMGITPIALLNTTNPGGTLNNNVVATFKGIVSADDAYNNVWISDAAGEYNGVMIYSTAIPPLVAVGDEIIISGKRSPYNNLTEIASPTLISTVSTGNVPYGPSEITGAVLNSTTAADTDPAEKWEGQLVKIDSVLVESYSSTDYEYTCTDDGGVTHFLVGDNVDYHLTNVTLKVGSYYDIVGVGDFSYGNYRINPRNMDDITKYAVEVTLPFTEAAEGGDLDLEWTFDPWGMISANHATLTVVDSSTSAWGSHVIAFFDSSYTGIAEVANATFADFTISSDIYLVGPADANFNLYTGLAIMADSNKYYRFVYRNSSTSDNGQLKLQGYDGAAWHISKNWNPGTDFTALTTGWHNFKVNKMGNNFWVYVDGVELPGCPLSDATPFMTEGAPGIYKYNTGVGTVLFDNFTVTESEPEEMTIAAAIADKDGDYKADMSGMNVTLTGIVNSPNFSYNVNAPASANYNCFDFYLQDATAGINLYSYSATGIRADLLIGDSIQVTGEITTYKGKNEIILASLADLVVLGHTEAPEPLEISLADVNSETYEGQLVVVKNLHPVKLSAWPVMDSTYANNYSVYATDGGSDTIQVYIDRRTDVPLWEGLPYFNFDVVGVISQYSSLPVPNNGYEVIPRFQTDITCHVPTEGIVTDLAEDFETSVPPTGWYSFVTDLDSGLVSAPWTKGTIAPVVGSYHAYMNNYNSASNCWLVTSPLSTKSEKKYLIFTAFDEVNTIAGNYGSELVVLAATESGLFADQWTEVKRITEAECIGQHPSWNVDLSTLSDTNYVYIAFMVHNFGSPSNPNLGGDNWIIDDVKMATEVGIKDEALPTVFALHQNYPNPFNPTTMIKYELPKDSQVKLVIYDLMGREVRTLVNAKQSAGYKAIQWDSKNNSGRLVSSGYYICVMNAGDFHKNIKMVLIK